MPHRYILLENARGATDLTEATEATEGTEGTEATGATDEQGQTVEELSSTMRLDRKSRSSRRRVRRRGIFNKKRRRHKFLQGSDSLIQRDSSELFDEAISALRRKRSYAVCL